MKHVHGLAFPDADAFMAAQMSPQGHYQSDHLDAALRYISDFSVALDGGAHVGTWSLLLSAVFKSVLAVEPSLDTFEALTANTVAFGCKNIVPINAALGASEGRVAMVIDAKNEARKNTGARYVQAGDAIRMITIDSLNIKDLGFLKLDVEGSEYQALLGARETLVRCRPIVLFEEKGFGSRFGGSRGQTAAFLTALDYQPLAVISADEIWGPR